jgi:hypothetical protein
MPSETLPLDQLQQQFDDIKNRLNVRKKEIEERKTITGQAFLDVMENENGPEVKTLLDVLSRKLKQDDQEKVGLAYLQKRLSSLDNENPLKTAVMRQKTAP